MTGTTTLTKSIMIHSPNGFNFDGLDCPDDLRRRFVAVRRSMNAEVRSLDAMVNNFKHTLTANYCKLLHNRKIRRRRRGVPIEIMEWLNKNPDDETLPLINSPSSL